MKSFKKNQIVIYTFALMLVAAGYLNYTSKVNKDSLETANQETYVSENETSDIGDAKLVNSNDVVDVNDKTNENVEENITDTKAQNTTENIEESKSENVVQTASNSTSNSDDYFVKSKLLFPTNKMASSTRTTTGYFFVWCNDTSHSSVE